MARLKVYTAEIGGVHEWIVAAPSMAAAARAWGVDVDVFSRGGGHVTKDETATKAALAQPGVALRRLKGKGAYKTVTEAGNLESWALAAEAVEAEPMLKRGRSKASLKAPEQPRKAPSRAPLNRAEDALRRFNASADAERQKIEDARAALDRQEAALDAKLSKKRQVLLDARDKARAAYEKAGG